MPISNSLRNQTIQKLNNAYLALFETSAGYDGSGTETTIGRKLINMQKVADGIYKNSNIITFNPADKDYGEIGYWAIFSEEASNEILWWGEFTVPIEIKTGYQFRLEQYYLEVGLK